MDETAESQPLVLVVDEIPAVIRLLQLELGIQGFRVASSIVGEETYKAVEALRPDVILLEVILPGMSGIEMMQGLRERFDTPIVFLTTQGTEADRLHAFELGATDFIEKPFDPAQLGLRLAGLIKHGQPEDRSIIIDDLHIDLRRQLAQRNRVPISLTTNEWTFLLSLSMEPRKMFSVDELIQMMWGERQPGWDIRLTHLAAAVRRKLEQDPDSPTLIVGGPMKGYALQADLTSSGPAWESL
jgi:DNA-binding response OmpR family regulator